MTQDLFTCFFPFIISPHSPVFLPQIKYTNTKNKYTMTQVLPLVFSQVPSPSPTLVRILLQAGSEGRQTFPEVRNRKRTEGGPVHSGEKPVVCKQCNFSCTPAGSLKIHMLIHSGGKPCACTQCSYSCTQADDLKKRLLAHSGEKPFVHTTFWLLTV